MKPTAGQRRDLSLRVRRERIKRHGTRRAAYSAAGINSASWTKVEDGEEVAERVLIAVIKWLDPESGGDWGALDPPLTAIEDDWRAVVEELHLDPETKAHIVATIEASKAAETARGRDLG